MNENSRGFCISCGVARNQGDTCDYCGRHYINPVETPQKSQRITALPEKYTIKKDQHSTTITWPWANRQKRILPIVGAMWLFVSLPPAIEFFADPTTKSPIQLIPLAVGILVVGHITMRLINKTSIFVSRQSLYVKHHPIPWGGDFKIATSDIEQVLVARIRRSNKKNHWQAPALQLITKDGKKRQLLRGKAEVEFSDFESLQLIILKALNIEPATTADAQDQLN